MTYSQVQVLQNSALIDRLNLILGERIHRLSRCQDQDFLQKSRDLNSSLNQAHLDSPEITGHQQQILSRLLDTLRESREVAQKCYGTSEIKSIKKPFVFSTNTENQNNPLNRLWWRALEPACYQIRLKGELKQVDGNACFAGDRLVVKSFEKQKADLIDTSLRFSYALLADLGNAARGGEFKMEDSFMHEFQTNNPILLLSALTAIGSSGPSGLTGWLQGLEDRLLIQDLNSSQSNEQILQHFTDLQTAKFNYIIFRDTVDRYHIKLNLYGQNINSWNRHNMMAAFLGCTQRASFERKTPALIYLTGVAYETKDFFSHLKEGVSLKASEQNFIDDTTRYRVSGRFGYDLCSPL